MTIINDLKIKFSKLRASNQKRQQDEAYERKKRQLIDSGVIDELNDEIDKELRELDETYKKVLKLVVKKK